LESPTLKAGREPSEQTLAASMTRSASKQTYSIVRFLVDQERVPEAYRAYAYFRWVDDRLDREVMEQAEGIAFINRQQQLLDCGYRDHWPDDLCVEERMLMHLVKSDREMNSGLQAYLRYMMAVMAFDASRRGWLISQPELDEYTHLLARAVTVALHYFIGHDDASPHNEARYLAASAAHITHMLRDTLEDAAVGYYNIPREYLYIHQIAPQEVDSQPYRAWVQSRVYLARRYFKTGQDYLAQVQNLRCRMAGYLYMAHFETVLAAIERDGYYLRPAYPEGKTIRTGIKMGWSLLSKALTRGRQELVSRPLPTR
ncbi:MAG TPA: squalene/phytoene synthase family protein, partial [Anaerolineae bacterium]|nr:squalene/phytoene synthase family protein [Anaerolineae bacterium]